jgi:hypothetical protein
MYFSLGVGLAVVVLLFWIHGDVWQMGKGLADYFTLSQQHVGWLRDSKLNSLPRRIIQFSGPSAVALIGLIWVADKVLLAPRWRNLLAPWLPSAAMALTFLITHPRLGGAGRDAFVVTLAASSLVGFRGCRRFPFSKNLLYSLILPSLMAGLLMAFVSTTDFWALAAGCWSAALTAVVLGLVVSGAAGEEGHLSRSVASWALVGGFAIILLGFQRLAFEETVPTVFQLTEQVENGPYLGLFTDVETKKGLENLYRDLQPYRSTTERVLFFPKFSAGYLFLNARPKVWNLFDANCPAIIWARCVDYINGGAGKPNLVVNVRWEEKSLNFRPDSQPELLRLIQQDYQLVQKRELYDIYVPNAGST